MCVILAQVWHRVGDTVSEVRKEGNRRAKEEQWRKWEGKIFRQQQNEKERSEFLLMILTSLSLYYKPNFYACYIISTCFNDT